MDIKAMLNGVGSPHARHEHHTLLPQDGPYVRIKCSCGVELSFAPVAAVNPEPKPVVSPIVRKAVRDGS